MKVRVSYEGPHGSGVAWFENLTDSIISGAAEIVEENVSRGEEITKHNIDTRGTFKSGKRGRIKTGRMRDSVDSKIVSKNASGVKGEFGWINEWQDYFGYQESGFNHVGGVSVDGMYALSDAAAEVFQDVIDDFDRLIKNA